MRDHLARRGGVWWVRLVVPTRLRKAAGRREFTKSTKTHELYVAKLVAAVMLADWRKQLLKLLEAAPALEFGGTISLDDASQLGVARADLLRISAAGRIILHCRLGAERGTLVPIAEMDYDGETGERSVPATFSRETTIATLQSGVLALPDSKEIANSLLATGDEVCRVVALQALGDRNHFFVPAANA
jgi:hypothetical protein